MTAREILDDLRRRGLNVRVEGGQLLVSPKSLLTEEIRSAIRRRREELLLEAAGPPRSERTDCGPLCCAECRRSDAVAYLEIGRGRLLCSRCWQA
jgi:hypothetical protein